jgi:hypothetical protein
MNQFESIVFFIILMNAAGSTNMYIGSGGVEIGLM